MPPICPDNIRSIIFHFPSPMNLRNQFNMITSILHPLVHKLSPNLAPSEPVRKPHSKFSLCAIEWPTNCPKFSKSNPFCIERFRGFLFVDFFIYLSYVPCALLLDLRLPFPLLIIRSLCFSTTLSINCAGNNFISSISSPTVISQLRFKYRS